MCLANKLPDEALPPSSKAVDSLGHNNLYFFVHFANQLQEADLKETPQLRNLSPPTYRKLTHTNSIPERMS